jgi:hypothetical protein
LVSLLDDLRPVVPALGVSPISAGLTSVKKFQQHQLPQSGFSVITTRIPRASNRLNGI